MQSGQLWICELSFRIHTVEICDHGYTLVVIIDVGLLLKDVSCRLRLLISSGCCNLMIEARLDMDVICLFVIDLLYKSCKPRTRSPTLERACVTAILSW